MRTRRTERGFTLIEVLVVVAIIALLVAILIPSLSRARDQARGAACRSNIRQVMLGMAFYSTDTRKLPGTDYIYAVSYGAYPEGLTWNGYGADSASLKYNDPQWYEKFPQVVRKGTIFRYVRNLEVYLCPDDQAGPPDLNDPRGGGGNGALSYSMNAYWGLRSPEQLGFAYTSDYQNQAGKTLYPRGSRKQWSASEVMLLFEEHPGRKMNDLTSAARGDGSITASEFVATRHSFISQKGKGVGRTSIGYLDTHVDSRLVKGDELDVRYLYDTFGQPNTFSGGGVQQFIARPK